MISYEQIKNWFSEKENGQKIVYGACYILVFIIGFGAGKFEKETVNAYQPKQINYTTKPPAGQTAGAKVNLKQPAVKGTSTPASCLIKGNINAKGYKIYHLPGGAFYKLVKPEQCFNTENEALAAGFVKSSR